MVYACNSEGVAALKKMSSLIEQSVEEIKSSTDTVRGVANDNQDALGPHANSLHEALDDIKACLEKSTSPVSDISDRLIRVANKYQAVIDDDPFGDSSGGGMEAAGFVGGGSAGSGGNTMAGGSAKSAMEPKPGASPRNLAHTQYGYSRNSRGESEYDSPMEMDTYLYSDQGSARMTYKGTCGLCSCANILRLAGVDLGEGDMIDFASNTPDAIEGSLTCPNLCVTNSVFPGRRGGTGPVQRKQILEHFGIQSELVDVPLVNRGGVVEATSATTDAIADYVSSGKGVILSVHCTKLDPQKYGSERRNDYHAVTVTSVTRDVYGTPVGFYICDSNQGTKFYYADEVQRALTGSKMNVTTQIIR